MRPPPRRYWPAKPFGIQTIFARQFAVRNSRKTRVTLTDLRLLIGINTPHESATDMPKNFYQRHGYDQPHNDAARQLLRSYLAGRSLGYTRRDSELFCPAISNGDNVSAEKSAHGQELRN